MTQRGSRRASGLVVCAALLLLLLDGAYWVRADFAAMSPPSPGTPAERIVLATLNALGPLAWFAMKAGSGDTAGLAALLVVVIAAGLVWLWRRPPQRARGPIAFVVLWFLVGVVLVSPRIT